MACDLTTGSPGTVHAHPARTRAHLPAALRQSRNGAAMAELAHSVPVSPMQTVKLGVQYSLWGGSVLNLGTERHRKK